MTDRTDTLPAPDLWHDPETGHWRRLTKPDRPTYEPYHAADTVRRLLAEQSERIRVLTRERDEARRIVQHFYAVMDPWSDHG